MQKGKMVPEIRFKGFEGKWVEYELGSLYSFLKGSNLSQDSFYYSNDKKAIAYGHLYTIYGPVINAVHLSSNEKTSLISKKNDLLFPGSSTVPLGTAQANAIMLNGVKLGGDIICARPIKDNVDSQFVSYQINAQKYKLFPIISGTTISHMYASGLKNTKWKFTTLDEQSTISDFFNNLLILIQSQELKLKKLNEVKQSLLNKMFASENQKFPEIRFKGFTEEWIKEKIKELAIFRRGSFPQPYGEEKWYSGSGAMPFVQVADIGNALSLNKKTNQLISKIAMPFSVFVPKDSVIVTLQGTIGRVALTNYDCFIDRTILYFNSYRKLLNKILFAILIKNKFEQEALLAPGAVIKTITKQKLNNFELFIPNFNEQQKIGQFFSNLDSLIRSQELKLEKLNNIKQALLEKMFC
ncbi:restriction endonuclease subunit S [Mycoplasma sp. VS424B]|uniref:restriction endonuclease subunit S n=1 Tax=Mycoplasma sp. VS424B TaxID=3401660 RepID=UPI003AAE5206